VNTYKQGVLLWQLEEKEKLLVKAQEKVLAVQKKALVGLGNSHKDRFRRLFLNLSLSLSHT